MTYTQAEYKEVLEGWRQDVRACERRVKWAREELRKAIDDLVDTLQILDQHEKEYAAVRNELEGI